MTDQDTPKSDRSGSGDSVAVAVAAGAPVALILTLFPPIRVGRLIYVPLVLAFVAAISWFAPSLAKAVRARKIRGCGLLWPSIASLVALLPFALRCPTP